MKSLSTDKTAAHLAYIAADKAWSDQLYKMYGNYGRSDLRYRQAGHGIADSTDPEQRELARLYAAHTAARIAWDRIVWNRHEHGNQIKATA